MSTSYDIQDTLQRIAVVRTDRLGDMVLTLPMCAAAQTAFPGAEIILITRSYVAPLLYRSPVIDRVIYADTPEEVSAAIRGTGIDMIFFPRPQLSEYVAAFRAGIPCRVGSGYRWYSFLLSHKQYDHRKTAEYHEAEYNTRLIERVLGRNVSTQLVRPVLQPESIEKVRHLLQQYGISDCTPIIIHPGSGGSAVDWPTEKFGEAARELQHRLSTPILLTGIPSESHLCDQVHKICPQAINLCGQLPLPDMMALLAGASLLIANSTGILHVAAALGTPVLGLYPQSPAMSAARWGPYTDTATVISPPVLTTVNDDMNMISVQEVVIAAQTMLDTYR
ncbi:MAG: glycosyltransferase family 9 protein [Candidatus Kapaibacterium sp.]